MVFIILDHVNTTQPTELPGNDFDPVKAEAGKGFVRTFKYCYNIYDAS
jgi:hypothetical protein